MSQNNVDEWKSHYESDEIEVNKSSDCAENFHYLGWVLSPHGFFFLFWAETVQMFTRSHPIWLVYLLWLTFEMFLIYVIPVKQDLYKPMILYSNISPKCIPKNPDLYDTSMNYLLKF